MLRDFDILNVEEPALAKQKVKAALEHWLHLLPESHTSAVFIKPNFNSNFSALTGNTTDLRLLAAVVEFLQSRGYSNLTIGDGPSGGFDRAGVSAIKRLKVDKLAAHYGVKVVDLNNCQETIDVPLENGLVIQAARVVSEADFVINMPKLKTHVETGMSVCLKSLMGVCVGITNKRKMHTGLADNIVRLNEFIRSDMYVIDGLIAMEGNGPSRGTPVNFGKVIIGTNPFQLDYICARLVGFPRERVQTIVSAHRMGHITKQDVMAWEEASIEENGQYLEPPHPNPLVSIAIDPRFQKWLVRVRYAPVMRDICSTEAVRALFYKLGLSQDRIREKEPSVQFFLRKAACRECGKCEAYCPLELTLDEIAAGGGDKCIGCLYCFSVCPQGAIELEGDLGYYADQIELYSDLIRAMA
jgi:uncharacterized protein (DUF362 family)/ferredoxin